jgi:hypothetical protein
MMTMPRFAVMLLVTAAIFIAVNVVMISNAVISR